MRPQEKVWGTTMEVFRNNTASTHYLEIKRGGYCSEHRHAQKSNIFYVLEGELEIVWWLAGDGHSVILDGDKRRRFRVPVGQWHKFHALTDVKCIEVYEYEYDGVDIKRRTEGGLDSTETDRGSGA